MRSPASFLCLLATACASGPRLGELHGAPRRTDAEFDAVYEARSLVDRDEPAAALEMLDAVIERSPRYVDAHRARQDLLRGRGRVGLVLAEAEERLDAWEDSADAWYLAGRLAATDDAKRAAFLRVLEREPNSFWGWFGLAFTYRGAERARSVGIYRELYEQTGGYATVALGLASTLRAAGQFTHAYEVYEALRKSGAAPGVGELGIVETKLIEGKRSESFRALDAALRARPFDPGIHRVIDTMLAQGLSETRVRQVLDVLFEEPTRLEAFGRGRGAFTLAKLMQHAGHIPAAQLWLERKDPQARTAVERRHARRLRLAIGDVRGFVELLRADVPRFLVDDERNRVRGRWLALLDGAVAALEDPLESGEHAAVLCRQLLDTGLLFEAELVATLAIARHGAVDAVVTARDEARRELAFGSAIRNVVYSGFHASERTLQDVVAQLRAESQRIHGRDVVGRPRMYSIPLVGQMLDPFDSKLARHLARYNRHLVLGRRWSGIVEGFLLTKLSDRELEPGGPLPLDGRCREIVGANRQIETLQGVLGGDLAGVALLDQYLIDFDAVQDWAVSIYERRRIAREDGLALLDDPVPARVGPLDAVDAEWRLSLLSPVPDDALPAAVFDMIAAHERAHLVDSFYFLPPASNLWRVLGLALRHFFRPLEIEAEMEGRAEAGALLASPHTELVLAHIAGFVAGFDAHSPHAIGFRDLAIAINQYLSEDPEWSAHARISRWHEVPADRMREAAARFLAR